MHTRLFRRRRSTPKHDRALLAVKFAFYIFRESPINDYAPPFTVPKAYFHIWVEFIDPAKTTIPQPRLTPSMSDSLSYGQLYATEAASSFERHPSSVRLLRPPIPVTCSSNSSLRSAVPNQSSSVHLSQFIPLLSLFTIKWP
jgi:hypothetical protein